MLTFVKPKSLNLANWVKLEPFLLIIVVLRFLRSPHFFKCWRILSNSVNPRRWLTLGFPFINLLLVTACSSRFDDSKTQKLKSLYITDTSYPGMKLVFVNLPIVSYISANILSVSLFSRAIFSKLVWIFIRWV